jgi:hypothetical protein
VASRFEAAPPAGATTDAAAAQLSALMGAATAGIVGMPRPSDPRARAAMHFVLQLGADALTTARRDAGGGALLALLGALVEGAPYDADADVALGGAQSGAKGDAEDGAALRRCYATARARAAARGWRLPGAPPEEEEVDGSGGVAAAAVAPEEAVGAGADVDAALSDAFAYALLVFWSRMGAA